MLDNNNKKIKCLLKFFLPCKEANVTNIPTLSPRLGQVGVNADGFCTVFNEECGVSMTSGVLIKVDVLVYEDRSYEIIEKGILYTFFLDLILFETNKILLSDLFLILNLICFFEKLNLKSEIDLIKIKKILKSLKNGMFSRNYQLINNLN